MAWPTILIILEQIIVDINITIAVDSWNRPLVLLKFLFNTIRIEIMRVTQFDVNEATYDSC
jgi:hypothetical protein